MPALIAFQWHLIVSNFQTDIILLNAQTEAPTYLSWRKQALPRAAPAQVFLPLLQIQLLLWSCLCEPAGSVPPQCRAGPALVLSREDTPGSPPVSSGCQGGASLPFIPELPQESCGLPRVRESIILLNFKGCVCILFSCVCVGRWWGGGYARSPGSFARFLFIPQRVKSK